jgi:hypothetical protein
MRASAFLVGVMLVAGCSGSDPGGGQSDPGVAGDGGKTASPGNGSGHGDGGGAAPAQDDPGVYIASPKDAWTDAPPFKSAPPAINANASHSTGSVTGKPCLGCHNGVTCVKFDFAGTVYKAPALTQGAADVEVRIIDATNYAHSVHSDADGNFWHFASTDLPMPAFSGVRTASFFAVGKLNGTSCNECHYDGNTHPTRLFVK